MAEVEINACGHGCIVCDDCFLHRKRSRFGISAARELKELRERYKRLEDRHETLKKNFARACEDNVRIKRLLRRKGYFAPEAVEESAPVLTRELVHVGIN